ncbi:hypothetical protein [Foetidibacter luteolus]|uniref:hypothetical protein n=1 Tax=Foetidibacter luteolus TaxID=2608880 RepID=UPI00129B3380|nr:hypothetical protein [Foetidibacter luteolus]
MSDKDVKRLTDLATEKLKKNISKKDALRSLMDAGILDKHGNFTPPYKNLATVSRS